MHLNTLTMFMLLTACGGSAPQKQPDPAEADADADADADTDTDTDTDIGDCVSQDLGSVLGEGIATGTNEGAGDHYTVACDDSDVDIIVVGDSGSYESEPEEAVGGEDVALTWTAPADGRYTFSTVGSTYDTVLSLLDGSTCDAEQLACSDDVGRGQSSLVSASLSGGDTVTVVIDADGPDQRGTWSLGIEEEICPGEDLGSALGERVAGGSNVGQGTSLDADCGSYSADVTFAWKAPSDGLFRFDTRGSQFDTVLVVVDGSCGGEQIECNDDHFGASSMVLVPLDAGQEVIVGVGGFGGERGHFALNINEHEAPSGDPTFPNEATCGAVCAAAQDAGCDRDTGCERECVTDLRDCPSEMQALLDCYLEEGLTCDPREDHGIGWGECAVEHLAVHDCGKDPF